MSVDALLEGAFVSWRGACSVARRDWTRLEHDPFAAALTSAPPVTELEGFADPLAQALAAWRRRLEIESALWPGQLALWRAWQTPHRCEQAEEQSLLQARWAWLSARDDGGRTTLAARFVELAAKLGDQPLDLLQERLDVGGGSGCRVAGLDADTSASLAVAVLTRTADAAAETMRRGWIAGSTAGLGLRADEGWPARLSERWLGEVLASGGLAEGLRPAGLELPRALGATSFSRALGALGAALLVAARPHDVAWSFHRLPFGSRHHVRAALLAGLTATVPFARRVLGLGQERAARQRRAMTEALLTTIRIDALRVSLGATLAQGKPRVRELYAELSEEMFAEPLPPPLLGVLPQLGPGDTPRLLGGMLALEQHEALVERHDVDWFRNPQAIAELRDQDERVEQPIELSDAQQVRLVERLVRHVEAALS